MPELILIPCSSSKNAANTHVAVPAGEPNIFDELTPPLNAELIAKRNLLLPFANADNHGFKIAYERYRGTRAWQYKSFNIINWVNRAHLDTHVLIVSALFGLLNPYSYIPNYNLKMKDKVTLNNYSGSVKRFWRCNNFLHTCLANYCVNNEIIQIHNLLTSDYEDAVQLHQFPFVVNYHWTDNNYGHQRGEWLGNNL